MRKFLLAAFLSIFLLTSASVYAATQTELNQQFISGLKQKIALILQQIQALRAQLTVLQATQKQSTQNIQKPAPKETPQQEQPKKQAQIETHVTFVVDGDTVEISTGERVRLIGIDSPERGDPYYTEARNKLSELVLNKQVRMEKDISERDRYGRLLRYLYVGNLFVNLEMVRQGYASVYTYPPDVKYSKQFLTAEQEARNKKVGLWIPDQPQPSQPLPVSPASFTVPSCAQTDCDCGDFSTHAYAQWFYDNHDPSNRHRLDGDRDGLACESLP